MKAIDYDDISQSLLEKAKPETANLVGNFKKLKKQYDVEVEQETTSTTTEIPQ